jgi:hypothetical protein
VIVVGLTTTTLLAAASPKLTVAPAAKLVPVIVTGVPPVEDPVAAPQVDPFGTHTELTVAPAGGMVPPVVKVQYGPLAVRLAIVLETIIQR